MSESADDTAGVSPEDADLDARHAEKMRKKKAARDKILATGPVRYVRTADIATFPYPTTFGLQGAASSILPYLFMRNRVQVVQVVDAGRTITILVNPTDPERSKKAPYFARLEERYGATATKLLGKFHNTIDSALAGFGVTRGER